MKSVVQNYKTGEIEVAEMPAPILHKGGLLVRNRASLVSAGTEKQMVELAQKSLAGKAKARPDLVRQVIEKARRDGILTTWDTVRRRLDTPLTMGYASAGEVLEVGENITGFKPGDRVACAGFGYASHAEIIYVPKNLTVPIPDNVSYAEAAYSTLGAIALQGVRLADPKLGEIVAVVGLGLLGLITAQFLVANGCTVYGIDLSAERAGIATTLGAAGGFTSNDHLAEHIERETAGHGADSVIITASTSSNGPVELAGEICRAQGRVVAVGLIGLDIPRKPYYEKEISFHISRSYGPGRYDASYEEKGIDYPYSYVRWTENRNMSAFLGQIARGSMNVEALTTHRIPIADGKRAYDLITGEIEEEYLGLVLEYPADTLPERRINLAPASSAVDGSMQVGMIGAGLFATSTLLPVMKGMEGVDLAVVSTSTGVNARHVANKFGFRAAATDNGEIYSDPNVNTVMITTRHDQHASQVLAAIDAGKHVFVEKPLCTTEEDLDRIVEAYANSGIDGGSRPLLMVGYNRRFAPYALELRKFFATCSESLMMHYRVNAGYIPLNHWVHDGELGGGRIIGEVCHFIDFLMYLSGSRPVHAQACALPNGSRYRFDNVQVTLTFENGSVGTIHYVANGDKAFAKESVFVSGGRASAELDNFRALRIYKDGLKVNNKALFKQDKGHKGELEAFAGAVTESGRAPIRFEEIVDSTRASIRIARALAMNTPVDIRLV